MNSRAALFTASVLTALAGAAAFPGVVGPSSAAAQTASTASAGRATADLLGSGGKSIGTVALTESARGVVLRVDARGLPAGYRGIHFHSVGNCSDAKFERSGGHMHEEAKSVHGLLNAQATDTGDLPNVHVAADGTLNAELFSPFVTLGAADEDRQSLLDGDGAAVLIHANADDHRSQPIGGAGGRIACGVVRRAR